VHKGLGRDSLLVLMLCVDWSGCRRWQTNSAQTVGPVRTTSTVSVVDSLRYSDTLLPIVVFAVTQKYQ